ncbi:putative oxidoreductase CzcO [Pseudovibrio axinellae]|uniref:4-hydroxybenzoate brominase (decarboxylating) n=1 Tax=Pseudovibrio axinellae TaxID=989403 RepID=A0A165T544_9HYPH|nr:NAD(P)-binding domain-containing protein [Pseudovibrio axinellae]KZL05445.1 putative oxidoreductase CzcO [Pseudovibrio axinellae]SEP98901.1 Predicted flavoprotein CzcO associated with the cation diffusion facilitator CzcD [Pseudovibrio axinellae]
MDIIDRGDAVCIAGAGPAGLVMARALQHNGLAWDQFDPNPDVGGLWDIKHEGTAIYESAHFISSRSLSGFADFPMPKQFADYPKHSEIRKYLRDFARAYGLREKIQFSTSIVKLTKTDRERWQVHLSNGQCREYKAIVCATGSQWQANMPDLKGTFDGEIRHSQTYKHMRELDGKRVLVIGAGNSGCDIACDAGSIGKQAFLSMRRGYHIVPKHVFGMPADVFADNGPNLPIWMMRPLFTFLLHLLNGNLQRLGIEKPDHKLFETHPILNTQLVHSLQHGDVKIKPDVERLDGKYVVFKDGSREEIDLILCATGYNQCVDFAGDLFSYQGGRPELFIQAASREHKNLFGISYIETNAGAYKRFDYMAGLVANYLKDQEETPERAAKMEAIIQTEKPDLTGGIRFQETGRHAGYCDAKSHSKYVAKLYKRLGWTLPQDISFKQVTSAAEEADSFKKETSAA